MLGILLWLAETIGGVALRRWLEGLFPKPAPDTRSIADAAKATAEAAQAKQDAQAAEGRAKVDQQVIAGGADKARQDMETNWNDPS